LDHFFQPKSVVNAGISGRILFNNGRTINDELSFLYLIILPPDIIVGSERSALPNSAVSQTPQFVASREERRKKREKSSTEIRGTRFRDFSERRAKSEIAQKRKKEEA